MTGIFQQKYFSTWLICYVVKCTVFPLNIALFHFGTDKFIFIYSNSMFSSWKTMQFDQWDIEHEITKHKLLF